MYSELRTHSPESTCFDTLQTTNTVGIIRSFVYPKFSWTISITGVTFDTFVVVYAHAKKTDFVEKRKESSKRTYDSTKWTLANDHPSQKYHQKSDFPWKQKSNLATDIST